MHQPTSAVYLQGQVPSGIDCCVHRVTRGKQLPINSNGFEMELKFTVIRGNINGYASSYGWTVGSLPQKFLALITVPHNQPCTYIFLPSILDILLTVDTFIKINRCRASAAVPESSARKWRNTWPPSSAPKKTKSTVHFISKSEHVVMETVAQ